MFWGEKKIYLFVIAILGGLFLYWIMMHIVPPLVRSKPNLNRADKYVKDFIGMKIPDNVSTPATSYSIGWGDSTYEFIFDADKSWRDSFIKKFNLVADSKISSSDISCFSNIRSRIPHEMKKMVVMKGTKPISWGKNEWDITFFIDPEGTFCFLQMFESPARSKNVPDKSDNHDA